jgi:integral membrane protein (TIGR01906 family)
MKKTHAFLKFIFVLSLTLFATTLSVKITVNFRQLYYFDIKHLGIEKFVDMSVSEIKKNYDYLISFLYSPANTQFKLPSFKASPEGVIHFYEVKKIFSLVDKIFYISLFLNLVAGYLCYKYKDFSIFKYSSWLLVSLPIFLLTVFSINFNKVFNTFHAIFFNNDYWIFDIDKDPVINILPEAFFMHCAILIAVLILISSLIYMIFYKSHQQTRKP